MGWQATGDSWTDGQSGQDHGLPELLAGFDHGGPWAEAAPSAALAAALERAAGPGDLYEGAETDALTGIARQWAAVESWPPCSRPAHDSDFEHAIPYDQGGATDACNAGARSRRCHQVKQMPGWGVTQPKPGWHVWTTPTGRIYVQEPWRYTA